MAAIKIEDIKKSLARLKRDISDVDDTETGTFLEWCNFANKQVFLEIVSIDNSRFIERLDYNSKTGTYPLPSDLFTMNGQTLGFFEVLSTGDLAQFKLRHILPGESGTGYYLEGQNVILNTSRNVVLKYIPEPVELTSEEKYFTLTGELDGAQIIPSLYKEALRDDLQRYYAQWDEMDEEISDFRFSRTLSVMQNNIARTTKSRRIPRYNNAY